MKKFTSSVKVVARTGEGTEWEQITLEKKVVLSKSRRKEQSKTVFGIKLDWLCIYCPPSLKHCLPLELVGRITCLSKTSILKGTSYQ